MVWVPASSVLMVTVARPPPLTGAVSTAPPGPPTVKATVPVGTPPAGGVTVAVRVTSWPTTDGSGEETTEVVVVAWATVWVSEPVDPVKSASPL